MEEEIRRFLKTKWAGQNLFCYDEIDSTNTCVLKLGEAGAIHGTVVVADQQNMGKGRRGRNWVSPPKTNIYMSLLLRPCFEAVKAPMLTLLMAYSVAEALMELEQVDAKIKWPNDIVLNKKKICGILTEMMMKEQTIDYVVIGVGINVNVGSIPQELRESATSLRIETGRELSRAALLARVLEKFEENYEQFCKAGDLSLIQDGYNRILVNAGNQVRILEPGNEYHGLAHGINHLGELQVEKEDGTEVSIFAGEVSVRGIYGYV